MSGPFFDEVEASYIILPDNTTAVIELRRRGSSSGWGKQESAKHNNLWCWTDDKDALEKGCTNIILGLGAVAQTTVEQVLQQRWSKVL